MTVLDLDCGWWRFRRKARRATTAATFLAAGLYAGAATAACGLCATEVATNSGLAACFLDRFDQYAARDGQAVAVDLDDCETDRGVVEALSAPTGTRVEPDLRFILSRAQLACFRDRVEAPELELDPVAVIRVDDCE